MERLKGRLKRALVGHYSDWIIEPAMRYMPIVRTIRRHGLQSQVTEVGSGSSGIAPYLGEPITGVDMGFDTPVHPLLEAMAGSALDLPFPDRSRPCVVSTDMLEHIPPDKRVAATRELVRVTSNLLILAVPTGPGAEAQDLTLSELYVREYGEPLPFLTEHVENGLPTQDEIAALLDASVRESGRRARVRLLKNSNLWIRMILMRTWIMSERPRVGWVWTALNHLHPLLSRANFGSCYRTIAVIEFE